MFDISQYFDNSTDDLSLPTTSASVVITTTNADTVTPFLTTTTAVNCVVSVNSTYYSSNTAFEQTPTNVVNNHQYTSFQRQNRETMPMNFNCQSNIPVTSVSTGLKFSDFNPVNRQTFSSFDKNFFVKILPEFDGTQNTFSKFLSTCDFYHTKISVNDEQEFIYIVLSKLAGRAYDTMRYYFATSYADLRVELVRQFRSFKTLPVLFKELTNIRQGHDENMQSYINRTKDLLNSLNEESIEDLTQNEFMPPQSTIDNIMRRNENLAKDAFFFGSKHPMSTILVSCRFNTLNETLAFAQQQCRFMQQKFCSLGKMSNHEYNECRRRKNQSSTSTSQNHKSRTFTPTSSKQTPPSSPKKPTSTTSSANRSPNQSSFCNYCKKKGHLITDCEKRKKRNNNLNQNQSTNSRPVDQQHQ